MKIFNIKNIVGSVVLMGLLACGNSREGNLLDPGQISNGNNSSEQTFENNNNPTGNNTGNGNNNNSVQTPVGQAPVGETVDNNHNQEPATPENIYNYIVDQLEKKSQLYESFSKDLKNEIAKHFEVNPNETVDTGYGYYITLFGRTAPRTPLLRQQGQMLLKTNKKSKSKTQEQQKLGFSKKLEEDTPEATPSSAPEDAPPADAPAENPPGTPEQPKYVTEACDAVCIDSPADKDEFTGDSVKIEGRMNLNAIAVFGPADPVLLISIFEETSGRLLTGEIPIYPQEIKASDNPGVATFSKPIAFPYEGTFAVLVSGFFNSGEGIDLLKSEMLLLTKQGIPEIKLISVTPDVNLLKPNEAVIPISNGAEISAKNLNFKIELIGPGLKTPLIIQGKQGKDIVDVDGNVVTTAPVVYSSQVAEAEAGEGDELGKKFYTFAIPMQAGINQIDITATNPILEANKETIAPEKYTIHFVVTNFSGGPKIKMLNPDPDSIIIQTKDKGEILSAKFCLTSLPSNKDLGGESCLKFLEPSKVGYTITVNDKVIEGAENIKQNSNGEIEVKFEPEFGINFVKVTSEDKIIKQTSTESLVFAYGKITPFIKDGQVYEKVNSGDTETFTPKGLAINLDSDLIKAELKPILEKLLAKEDLKKKFFSTFKKEATTPAVTCTEIVNSFGPEQPVYNHGDSSVTFLEDTMKIGDIELQEFKTSSASNSLELKVHIGGLHGELDLKGLGKFSEASKNSKYGFLPVSLYIKSIDVRVGVEFVKSAEGILQVKIKRLDDTPIVLVGDGPMGNVAHINSDRNPKIKGLEDIMAERGLLEPMFKDILQRVILCDVEEGMNHQIIGSLGKHVKDIEKLVKYNQDIFRLPIDSEIKLLSKQLQLDVAYNLLRGDISITDHGIHIKNIPLRINPGPNKLHQIRAKEEFQSGSFGPLVQLHPADASETIILDTNQYNKNNEHNIGLALSVDAINQAFYSANAIGLLDVDVDPNFYSNAEIIPIKDVAPMVDRFFGSIDINKNGKNDTFFKTLKGSQYAEVTENYLPLRISLRTSKQLAPMLTVLSANEIETLNKGENDGFKFDPDQKYFKIIIPQVEVLFFALEPISPKLGGYKSYCTKELSETTDNDSGFTEDLTKSPEGFCPMGFDLLLEKQGEKCEVETAQTFTFPVMNGKIISGDPAIPDSPLVILKGNVALYGWIVGINRQISPKDRFLNPEAKPEELIKTFLRMRFSPINKVDLATIYSAPGISAGGLADTLNQKLKTALGTTCVFLNELRIPIPDRFPALPTNEAKKYEDGSLGDTLCGLGVDHLSFGTEVEKLPSVLIDDNSDYLDILAGIHLVNDGDSCPTE